MIRTALIITFIFYSISSVAQVNTESTFPSFDINTLDNQSISIPEDLNSDANIIVLSFKENVGTLVDSWISHISEKYESNSNINHFVITLKSGMAGFFSDYFDKKLANSTKPDQLEHVGTFYGDRAPIFARLDLRNKYTCYVFVVNSDGEIIHRTEGFLSESKRSEFDVALRQLAGITDELALGDDD